MKHKPARQPERHRYSRIAFYLGVFVVAPVIGTLAAVPLLGLCIIYAAAGLLGEALGSLIGSLVLFLLNLHVFMPLVHALISGDWTGLFALLPGFLAWLRSAGLL
jgi:hypothetical protein